MEKMVVFELRKLDSCLIKETFLLKSYTREQKNFKIIYFYRKHGRKKSQFSGWEFRESV